MFVAVREARVSGINVEIFETPSLYRYLNYSVDMDFQRHSAAGFINE